MKKDKKENPLKKNAQSIEEKKVEIIPAILEKTFSKIENKFDKIKNLTNLIQVDIFDGRLVPSKTFASAGCLVSFERLLGLQKKSLKNTKKKFEIELDLIIDMENGPKGRGDKFLDSILFLKPARVVFHFSGVENWEKIFQKLKTKSYSLEIALGVWLSDDVRKVNKVLEKYDFSYIQIMGIEKVGYGGQKLSPKVFSKIKYFAKKYPKLPIQIDGGVKIENAKKLKKVGATRLVSGSGIFKAKDIRERIEEFEKI